MDLEYPSIKKYSIPLNNKLIGKDITIKSNKSSLESLIVTGTLSNENGYGVAPPYIQLSFTDSSNNFVFDRFFFT